MSEYSKIATTHLRRAAVVYVRQSSASQLERNRESTDRQYGLVERAVALGWPRGAVRVIDADLGISGAQGSARRSNSDWYRLLDLAGLTDTLLADTDGVYHPGLFNDRLTLGLKGTMAEAELHVLRARLDGGIRNKAERGELRRALPVGLVWGEEPGEVRPHPDEAVTGVIRAIFDRFAACGSVRATWLWLRGEGLSFPLQRNGKPDLDWVAPTYTAVHHVLTNPAYAGAYAYGKTRQERRVDETGTVQLRRRPLAVSDWEVLIRDHHKGFIGWDTYQANQARINANIRPVAHAAGDGAVREGTALLQGLAVCGTCARKLAVFYQGRRKSTPGYYCTGTGELVEGRGVRHLRVGGVGIDAAVTAAFLAALAPAGLQACLAAAEELETGADAALAQWRRQVERARYQAAKAERRYLAVDPDNRLVARGLEADWETALRTLADAEAELGRREAERPKTLTAQEKSAVLALGDNITAVWEAPTTTDRDRKELLRTLLDEVIIRVDKAATHAALARWSADRTDRRAAAPGAAEDPHRRGHHRPDSPPRRTSPRHGHRRNPQPARPHQRPRADVHRLDGVQPAHPLEDPPLPAGQHAQHQRTGHRRSSRPRTRRRPLDRAPVDHRRVHPRGADHPRRAMAHPAHRPAARPLRRRHSRRLPAHARNHARPRNIPPNGVAACQAWRPRRRARPSRTQKRPTNKGSCTHKGPVLTTTSAEGAV